MKNQNVNNILLVLGMVWVIMGLIYQNSGVWQLGLIFLILGLVGKYRYKKQNT